MSAAIDPFTELYKAIWSHLAQSPRLSSLVKLRNRIDYSEENKRDPRRLNATTADLPEATLVPAAMTPFNWATSHSWQFTVNFELQVLTGSLRVDQNLFPIQWATVAALTDTENDMQLPNVVRID